MHTLKLKYIDGNIFEDEHRNQIGLIFRGYLGSLQSNQWYYCQIQGITLYEFVPA
jgi:hypothetical protein